MTGKGELCHTKEEEDVDIATNIDILGVCN